MRLEDKSPALAELTDAQREQAMTRFSVLRSHVERGVPLPRAAQAAGVVLRTVERWLAQYRADGLTGLVRRTREDRGRRRLPVETVELIEGLFLKKPRPSAAAVYRRVLTLCKEREWASPSYSTVYAIISRLDPGLITLAHEGPARFRDKFELVHRHRASRPNAVWQADHTQLDLLLRDASGKPVRPWLTTVIDDHSRALAGYSVFVDAPSAFQTSLALRQAIWRKADPLWAVCGIPDVLYVDHGSDFTSKHLEQSLWTCISNWSTRPSPVLKDVERSSVSLELSTPDCCQSYPATSCTASRQLSRACPLRNWIAPSEPSLSVITIPERIARSGLRRKSLGRVTAGCPACRTAWKT